jgi:hypothetical protein
MASFSATRCSKRVAAHSPAVCVEICDGLWRDCRRLGPARNPERQADHASKDAAYTYHGWGQVEPTVGPTVALVRQSRCTRNSWSAFPSVVHQDNDCLFVAVSDDVTVADRLERESFVLAIFRAVHHYAGGFGELGTVSKMDGLSVGSWMGRSV